MVAWWWQLYTRRVYAEPFALQSGRADTGRGLSVSTRAGERRSRWARSGSGCRNLRPFQRAELALAAEEPVAAEAERRMKAGDPPPNLAEGVQEQRHPGPRW